MRRSSYEELWTLLAFVAIVACFLAATTFTERRMGLITTASRRMSDVCVPAMVEASRMQGDLARLQGVLAMRSAGGATADLLGRLEDEGRRGSALAMPDARQRWAAVRDEVGALHGELQPYVGAEPTGPPAEERRVSMQRIASLGTYLDAIAGAESERAVNAQRDVQSARAWTGRFTYGLDVVCIFVAGLVALQTLRRQRARRRAVEERLDDLEAFAVRVAHDIRSPLTPALLALQKADARLEKDDPARETVERGIRSVHTIARTVEGLLAFASAGAKPAAAESCSLVGTFDAVVAEYLDEASARAIEIAVECADGETSVACSAGVLASIVGNLVGNAIKFMRGGGKGRVVIRAHSTDGRVHLEVEDTGPGLADGAEACIFDPYVRGDASTRGLGLGLATVKRLVTAHGGAVGVRRGRSRGCVFWVELPAGPRLGRQKPS